MIKMISTVAVLLALASPAFAGGNHNNGNNSGISAVAGKVGGSVKTTSFGNVQTGGITVGHAIGAAGSVAGGTSSAQLGGGVSANTGNQYGNAQVGGSLSAGSSSTSVAGSAVLGTGFSAQSTRGSSGAGASVNVSGTSLRF